MVRLTGLALAAVALGAVLPALAAPPLVEPPRMPLVPEAYVRDMLSGGPSKDGIPSIDDPVFESAAEAGATLDGADRVIGVYRNGEARAYPQRVLVWHEIVNDTIGGEPVSITYCPLTGTALGFRRGETELGVSGRLVNSNLVMYDRASDSLWPQILGAAVSGPHKGAGLDDFRVVWTTWARWRERHPDTRVLSSDTGYIRNYRHDPYGDYNPLSGYYLPRSERLFPVQNRDERYPAKQEIFGFRTDDGAVAVDRDHLATVGHVTVEHGGARYLVLHDPGLATAWVLRGVPPATVPADVTFGPEGPKHPDLDGMQAVNGFEAMWFAWAAFYPESRVVGGP